MPTIWKECYQAVMSIISLTRIVLCSALEPKAPSPGVAPDRWAPTLTPSLHNHTLGNVTSLRFNRDDNNNKEVIR